MFSVGVHISGFNLYTSSIFLTSAGVYISVFYLYIQFLYASLYPQNEYLGAMLDSCALVCPLVSWYLCLQIKFVCFSAAVFQILIILWRNHMFQAQLSISLSHFTELYDFFYTSVTTVPLQISFRFNYYFARIVSTKHSCKCCCFISLP